MPRINLNARNDKNLTMILGIALAALTYLSGILVTPLATSLGLNDQMVRIATRAVVGTICMIAMGGASYLRPVKRKIIETWRYARPLILINVVVGILMGAWATILLLFLGGLSRLELLRFLNVTVLCLFVGINEEIMFRGLMFGGLLAKVGGRRNGPLAAALISSIAFGLLHVIFDVHLDSPLEAAQALAKTLETGMFGFVLCVSVLEGRNLVGAMTAHAFFDWIILVANSLSGDTPTGQYISSDATVGLAATVVLLVFCVLYLPKTIQSFRRLSTVRLPQYGPFVPAEESAVIEHPAGAEAQSAKHQATEEATVSRTRKARTHKLANNKVLTIFVCFFGFALLGSLVNFVSMLIFGTGTTAAQLCSALGTALLSLAIVLILQQRLAGRFDGITGWVASDMLLALPAILLGVANVFEWPGATFNNPLYCLILALAPGFSEEIVFRAIPISNWMRLESRERDILPCVMVTSAAFAVTHALNLLAGATLSATIFQVFYAFCVGSAFSAVLLRTGSIWPSIILHTFVDFMSYLTMDMSNMGILATEVEINAQFWFVIAVSAILLGWALFLLRPSMRREVSALWRVKWHKTSV